MVKTITLDKVRIWRHQNDANGIAISFGETLTSVNNIEGSVRCHKNLYSKLDEILKKEGL